MICPKIFLVIRICAFFFFFLYIYIYIYIHIDFSCYPFLGFHGSACKFFGRGGQVINFRVKSKFCCVDIYTN